MFKLPLVSGKQEQELARRCAVVVCKRALRKHCGADGLEARMFNHPSHVALHLHEDADDSFSVCLHGVSL